MQEGPEALFRRYRDRRRASRAATAEQAAADAAAAAAQQAQQARGVMGAGGAAEMAYMLVLDVLVCSAALAATCQMQLRVSIVQGPLTSAPRLHGTALQARQRELEREVQGVLDHLTDANRMGGLGPGGVVRCGQGAVRGRAWGAAVASSLVEGLTSLLAASAMGQGGVR